MVRFLRGQALFTQGDRAERVFVIERGWVMITSIAPGGREIVLGLRGPDDVIGDISALDGALARRRRSRSAGRGDCRFRFGATPARGATTPPAMDLLCVLASRLRDADRKRLEFAETLDTLGHSRKDIVPRSPCRITASTSFPW